jgi:hypothetical protein
MGFVPLGKGGLTEATAAHNMILRQFFSKDPATRMGDHESALGHLEHLAASRRAGFVSSPAKLAVDPRWDPIRAHPRFLPLLEKWATSSLPHSSGVRETG